MAGGFATWQSALHPSSRMCTTKAFPAGVKPPWTTWRPQGVCMLRTYYRHRYRLPARLPSMLRHPICTKYVDRQASTARMAHEARRYGRTVGWIQARGLLVVGLGNTVQYWQMKEERHIHVPAVIHAIPSPQCRQCEPAPAPTPDLLAFGDCISEVADRNEVIVAR